jgi:hypothetical protein
MRGFCHFKPSAHRLVFDVREEMYKFVPVLPLEHGDEHVLLGGLIRVDQSDAVVWRWPPVCAGYKYLLRENFRPDVCFVVDFNACSVQDVLRFGVSTTTETCPLSPVDILRSGCSDQYGLWSILRVLRRVGLHPPIRYPATRGYLPPKPKMHSAKCVHCHYIHSRKERHRWVLPQIKAGVNVCLVIPWRAAMFPTVLHANFENLVKPGPWPMTAFHSGSQHVRQAAPVGGGRRHGPRPQGHASLESL